MLQEKSMRIVKRKRTGLIELSGDDSEVMLVGKRTRKSTNSISDELAGDKFHYVNYLVTHLKFAFHDKPSMWHVDKYYPYAKNGAIYFDEPRTPQEIDLCSLKREFLHKHAIRYIVIEPKKSLEDLFIELERMTK